MWESDGHTCKVIASMMYRGAARFASRPNIEALIGWQLTEWANRRRNTCISTWRALGMSVASWMFKHRRDWYLPTYSRALGKFRGYLAILRCPENEAEANGWWNGTAAECTRGGRTVTYERLTGCPLEQIHVLNVAVSECFGAGQCVGGKRVGCAVGLRVGLPLVLAGVARWLTFWLRSAGLSRCH